MRAELLGGGGFLPPPRPGGPQECSRCWVPGNPVGGPYGTAGQAPPYGAPPRFLGGCFSGTVEAEGGCCSPAASGYTSQPKSQPSPARAQSSHHAGPRVLLRLALSVVCGVTIVLTVPGPPGHTPSSHRTARVNTSGGKPGPCRGDACSFHGRHAGPEAGGLGGQKLRPHGFQSTLLPPLVAK